MSERFSLEGVTASGGLLWRDGKVISVQEADWLAQGLGYGCAENLVKFLATPVKLAAGMTVHVNSEWHFVQQNVPYLKAKTHSVGDGMPLRVTRIHWPRQSDSGDTCEPLVEVVTKVDGTRYGANMLLCDLHVHDKGAVLKVTRAVG